MMTPVKRPLPLRFVICILLALITLITFWSIRYNDFILLDDNLYITDNPFVKTGLTLNNLWWAFSNVYAGHWHPVTWLSHMVDVELFGLQPRGHHLVSLFLHTVNSLLLFFLFQRMTGRVWQSAFVAGLFALHPLRVESVVWAAERKDVLSAFFFILTIHTYLRYVHTKELTSYLAVMFGFTLALMSKPMAVTLPFCLLLLDFWPLGRFQTANHFKWNAGVRLIAEKTPLFLFTGLMCAFTYINHLQSGAVASLDKLPLAIRIGNALISYLQYIWKMFWPDSLAVLYPHPIHLSAWEVAGAVLLLITITLAVIYLVRENPYLIVGWFWFLGTLIPVIGLVQAGIQSMADRFTYIPMIGLYVMVAYGVSTIFSRWRFRKIILFPSGASILLILALLSSIQVDRWRNSVTLFTHTLKVTSNNYLIYNNLGATLMRQGNYQEAMIHFKKAIEIKPNYADAYHNLGSLLLFQKNEREALVQFFLALKFNPEKAEIHNAIGGAMAKQNKLYGALFHFSEAIRINKDYGEAHYNLGTIYLRVGRIQEALNHLAHALKIHPENSKTHYNLGLALERAGKAEEAMSHYRASLRIDPNHANSHFCLASLLLRQNRGGEAIFHLFETITLNPKDSEAHYELGRLLFQQGKKEEAIIHLIEATTIAPDFVRAHLTLGEFYHTLGMKKLALKQYATLQSLDKNLARTFLQNISQNKD